MTFQIFLVNVVDPDQMKMTSMSIYVQILHEKYIFGVENSVGRRGI